MNKLLQYINNERNDIKLKGAKACTEGADDTPCAISSNDVAACTQFATDYCPNVDYGACTAGARDACEYEDRAICVGVGSIDFCEKGIDYQGCYGVGARDYSWTE